MIKEQTMLIPEAFKRLGKQFHQDVAVVHESSDDMIKSAIRGFNQNERRIIAAFLDELLSDRYNDIELRNVWWKSSAEIDFASAAQLRSFLRLVRSKLPKSGAGIL
jgi:hypothetical protein